MVVAAWKWGLCLLLTLTLCSNSWAEMDDSEYQSKGVITDPEERQRLQRIFADERAAEAQRQAERAAQDQAEQARLAILEASRPYPERLRDMRCGTCHTLSTLEPVRHTQAGWYLTINRMRWLNGAHDIDHPETLLLSQYLADNQGLRGSRAWLEYAWVLLTPLLLVWGSWWAGAKLLAWRHKRHS